jgi:3-phenylpropionate/trans-cinnamate dioxygenase ferredoxin component
MLTRQRGRDVPARAGAWTGSFRCVRVADVPEVKLARLSEIPEGGMICRRHGDRQVALARIGGGVYAMNDVCTHAGAPLHEGDLGREGDFLVTCPWHEAHFDFRTGKVHQDTAWGTETLVYPVRVDGDDVFVELPVV